MSDRRIYAPWPAVPANGATILLFAWGPVARVTGTSSFTPTDPNTKNRQVDAVTITWQRHNKASAANGLRCYALGDDNVFYETDLKNDSNASTIGASAPIQIPALAADQEWRETLIVSHLKGGAIEYTAGPDNPENWNGTIAVDISGIVLVR